MTESEKNDYLKKRELVLETLSHLFDDWDMAESLYNLVKSSEVTPNVIDTLVKILDMSFKDAKTDEAREKLAGAMNSLKSIKDREMEEREQEKLSSINIISSIF